MKKIISANLFDKHQTTTQHLHDDLRFIQKLLQLLSIPIPNHTIQTIKNIVPSISFESTQLQFQNPTSIFNLIKLCLSNLKNLNQNQKQTAEIIIYTLFYFKEIINQKIKNNILPEFSNLQNNIPFIFSKKFNQFLNSQIKIFFKSYLNSLEDIKKTFSINPKTQRFKIQNLIQELKNYLDDFINPESVNFSNNNLLINSQIFLTSLQNFFEYKINQENWYQLNKKYLQKPFLQGIHNITKNDLNINQEFKTGLIKGICFGQSLAWLLHNQNLPIITQATIKKNTPIYDSPARNKIIGYLDQLQHVTIIDSQNSKFSKIKKGNIIGYIPKNNLQSFQTYQITSEAINLEIIHTIHQNKKLFLQKQKRLLTKQQKILLKDKNHNIAQINQLQTKINTINKKLKTKYQYSYPKSKLDSLHLTNLTKSINFNTSKQNIYPEFIKFYKKLKPQIQKANGKFLFSFGYEPKTEIHTIAFDIKNTTSNYQEITIYDTNCGEFKLKLQESLENSDEFKSFFHSWFFQNYSNWKIKTIQFDFFIKNI